MGNTLVPSWITLMALILSPLLRATHGGLLNAQFEETRSSGRRLRSYNVQNGFRSCSECASVCLDDGDTPDACRAFGCDVSTMTCTFYTKGDTALPSPDRPIFIFRVTDIFHTVTAPSGKLYSFYLSSTKTTFHQARSHCHSLGGYLLQFDSLEEHWAVKQITLRQKTKYAYIGISDERVEDDWVTDRDGAPISSGVYLWLEGEPSRSTEWEDCGLVDLGSLHCLDTSCTVPSRYFLCERDG